MWARGGKFCGPKGEDKTVEETMNDELQIEMKQYFFARHQDYHSKKSLGWMPASFAG